jgi:Zn-dependent peptidase ImmA (M78 family)
MSNRTELLLAGRRAAEVLHEFKCREKIKSGYTRIDPVSIAHQANVTVMFRQLDQLLGGFIRESSPGILVNLARPRGMVHMTCAHELGHFFLGHETIMDREIEYSATADVIERQADQFAYSLLAPQWLIAHIARAKQWGSSQLENPQNIYQLSLRLGASYTATAWTLERLRLIRSGVASEVVRIPPQSIKKQLLGNAVLKDWNRDVWLLDETDRDHIIEPILGDGVVIDLANHSAAGYLWSLDEAS